MRTALIAWWDAARGSYWFIPGLFTLSAVILGVVLPEVDVIFSDLYKTDGPLGWIVTTGPAARATLSSLAGALMTVASIVFSVTMVTLSLTTSQYGPRLLRSFLNNNLTQVTLGAFLGSSIYCLLVLKSVRTMEGPRFVPHLSVAVGVGVSLVSIAIFIAFIHHIAQSIRADNVIFAVASDLNAAIDRLFPVALDGAPEGGYIMSTKSPTDAAASSSPFPASESVPCHSREDGYIAAFDRGTIISAAAAADCVVRLSVRPGDFITRQMRIGEIVGLAPSLQDGESPSAPIEQALNEATIVDSTRTPRQDVGCAMKELVEVAVRALSPGINDPMTAIACIDYLGGSLSRLATRHLGTPDFADETGAIRLSLPPVHFSGLLDEGLSEIRHYGQDTPSILLRLLDALLIIAPACQRSDDINAVLRHADIIQRAAKRNLHEPDDLNRIELRMQRFDKYRIEPDN